MTDDEFTKFYMSNTKLVSSELRKYEFDSDILEELAQEVWLRVWTAYETFNSQAKLTTWVTGVAKNVARNYLRDEVERAPVLVPDTDLPGVSIDESSDSTLVGESWLEAHAVEFATPERHAEAEDALEYYERLPKQQREVLDRLAMGDSYADIAESLGISQSTVRSHIASVKAALGF